MRNEQTSVYASDLNIKHYNRSHLFWGIDKEMNEIVYIDDIRNRGLDCNCRCAQCNGDFIARLGDINRHHFAHQSNYDCLYANEIAFYLRAQKWLTQSDALQVPTAFFEFGNRKDIAVSERDMPIGNVFYECDSTQYPPLLVVETKKRPIRIILGFGSYYSKEDRALLKEEAIQKGWDCLIINMPKISDQDPLSGDQFGNRLRMWANGKEWIYCIDSVNVRHELEAMAITPKAAFENKYAGCVECPLHYQFLDGKYCASPRNCGGCRYNLAKAPHCMCLAHVGIEKYSDLQLPTEKRISAVTAVRNANDMTHRLRAQALQRTLYNPPSRTALKVDTPALDLTPQKNTTSNLRGDRTVNSMGFNPELPIEEDRFGRRWVQCRKCKEIITTLQCYEFDRSSQTSCGICRICARGNK